jgi:hypothetical protein
VSGPSLDPGRWTDSVWRALVVLVAVAGGVYLAWQVLRLVLGPLVLAACVVGIIRLAMLGYRRHSGW